MLAEEKEALPAPKIANVKAPGVRAKEQLDRMKIRLGANLNLIIGLPSC